MSVRVVTRIRPLLKSENERDTIIEAVGSQVDGSRPTAVKIPNPKNFSETYTFQFSSVYGQQSSQQELFDAEVAPTVKHLFLGYDVTIFAYGSTGTGKTHTMRGAKSLAERGMIPRLLSSIYRRSRKLMKDSDGKTTAEISMSYYEIYNDKVFDLLETPEKRTALGLPLREAGGGKTVVVGLSETPCGTLKEFEQLYDKANSNRSTSATKLNAYSSRSHAILCVKLTVTTPTEVRVSTASAIDLAGSEDNRRTGNDRERMVESASINKSLFVLAQCVEAISKKQPRIPYRESKMTRILSLGQNNGFTVMILNLAPVRSYHLDALSSLNFANRTKKIEVREVENEPIFKGPPRVLANTDGPNIQRQPLRPLASGMNINLHAQKPESKTGADKPSKAFSVFSDRAKPRISHPPAKSSPLKRSAEALSSSRPAKIVARQAPSSLLHRGYNAKTGLSKAGIGQLVEEKVQSILAAQRNQESQKQPQLSAQNLQGSPQAAAVSEEVQRRLASIEERLQGQEGAQAEGLQFLLMAKQHQAHGEDSSALRMYLLAKPYFPGNEKLVRKIEGLQQKVGQSNRIAGPCLASGLHGGEVKTRRNVYEDDASFHDDKRDDIESDDGGLDTGPRGRARQPKRPPKRTRTSSPDPLVHGEGNDFTIRTPRTSHLLSIINTQDFDQIKGLRGVGPKRAEGIIECVRDMGTEIINLRQLGGLRGVGVKIVEGMRAGVEVV